jgi:hypothetical protein
MGQVTSDGTTPPKAVPDPKAEAERDALERYRATHSADGYALGSPEYPDNRQGRRALARTWKRRPLKETP